MPVARDAGDAFVEVWTTGRPVHAGRRAGLAYGHDGEFAFCAGRLPPAGRYAATVRAAYLDAFHLLRELGYPYLLRMWNYIGGINEPNAEGLETYRDFCRGRAEAFDHSPLPSDRMPAGTAVGALRPGIDFYLIAWRRDGHVAVENALQIPAYSYPERYGPRSPSFARAVHLPDGGGMLVSGTASILGHETVDAGDAAAQCRTTLANLAALVDPANLARHGIEDLRGRCFLDGSLELRWSGHSLDLLAYAQERTTQAARLRTTPASAQGNILDSRLNGRSHNE